MQIEVVTKQDLEAFKNDLLQALTAFVTKEGTPQEKEWLRSKEVRQMLGISSGTLQNLRIKGLLKPSKIQGTFYYRLNDVQKLFNANTK